MRITKGEVAWYLDLIGQEGISQDRQGLSRGLCMYWPGWSVASVVSAVITWVREKSWMNKYLVSVTLIHGEFCHKHH